MNVDLIRTKCFNGIFGDVTATATVSPGDARTGGYIPDETVVSLCPASADPCRTTVAVGHPDVEIRSYHVKWQIFGHIHPDNSGLFIEFGAGSFSCKSVKYLATCDPLSTLVVRTPDD
ncbi:MAG: hypothetical protein LC723_04005 [Actinobacteria bacterium]|nr:hypothetical protein [Actinomycetota bacterium]